MVWLLISSYYYPSKTCFVDKILIDVAPKRHKMHKKRRRFDMRDLIELYDVVRETSFAIHINFVPFVPFWDYNLWLLLRRTGFTVANTQECLNYKNDLNHRLKIFLVKIFIAVWLKFRLNSHAIQNTKQNLSCVGL